MPAVHSQFSNLLTPSGPSHGDWGAALHQLWNTGLPVRTDYKPGSEYSRQIFCKGKKKKPTFPVAYRGTTVLDQTSGPSVIGGVLSSNHKQTQDFQNFWIEVSRRKEGGAKNPEPSTNTFLGSSYIPHSFFPLDQLFACGDDFQCQPTTQRVGLYYLVQSVNQRSSGRSSVHEYWLSVFSLL